MSERPTEWFAWIKAAQNARGSWRRDTDVSNRLLIRNKAASLFILITCTGWVDYGATRPSPDGLVFELDGSIKPSATLQGAASTIRGMGAGWLRPIAVTKGEGDE